MIPDGDFFSALTSQEIERLISVIPKNHIWQPAGYDGYQDITNGIGSYRASVYSHKIASFLWSHISHAIPYPVIIPNDIYEQNGIWTPIGLNPLLRYIKYIPGCYLLPHYDLPWIHEQNNLITRKSVVFYLSKGIGGNTRFVKDTTQKTYEEMKTGDWLQMPVEEDIMASIDNNPGDVLIFPHEKLHDSSLLTSGSKLIIRTDVVYKKVG